MKCRVCRKEFGKEIGWGRYNDHILLQDPSVTEPICSKCATENPDEHHVEFNRQTKNMNLASADNLPRLLTPQRRGIVVIPVHALRKLCDCKECKNEMDEFCDKYRKRVTKAFPLGEPYEVNGNIVIPVAGGYIPKRLYDFYCDNVIERLKKVGKVDKRMTKRLLWNIEQLDDERRQMHIALLAAAGFTPFETGTEAMAWKIIVEENMTARCRQLGVIP